MKQSIWVATAMALALSGCGDKEETTSKADAPASMDKIMEQAKEMGTTMKETASDTGSHVMDKAGDTMDAAKDAAGDAVDAARETAGDAVEAVQEKMESATESAREMGTSLMQQAGEKVNGAMDSTGMADAGTETAAAGAETVVASAAAVSTVDPEQLAMGKKIFSGNCFACHGSGIAGAPKLGDKTAWSARIDQGMTTLVEHSIKGYRGKTGYMPPKGGFTTLSDDQVSAATAYLVDQSK